MYRGSNWNTQSEKHFCMKRFSNCTFFEPFSLKPHSLEGNRFSKCYTLSTAAVLLTKLDFVVIHFLSTYQRYTLPLVSFYNTVWFFLCTVRVIPLIISSFRKVNFYRTVMKHRGVHTPDERRSYLVIGSEANCAESEMSVTRDGEMETQISFLHLVLKSICS